MNPYKSLEERAFWSPAVARRNMFDVSDLWRPRFKINRECQIATFGSCFAQHFSQALIARGFTWFNGEPAPVGLSAEDAKIYSYGIFSARTGNIYTTSLLLQWTEWALGHKVPPDVVWEKDGRFYDPFRPRIEPEGFASREECLNSRDLCIAGFCRAITLADTFVFTLGLTESWVNSAKGYEFPVCPGAIDESFAQPTDTFVNQRFVDIHRNLHKAITLMRQAKRGLRFLLTVSPVPLTATNSGGHVLVATMESKSRLRTVAGELADELRLVDYFPSYEIINAPTFRGTFFEANQRSVNPNGVDFVMRSFFEGLARAGYTQVEDPSSMRGVLSVDDVPVRLGRKSKADLICEEEMLAAFGPVSKQPAS